MHFRHCTGRGAGTYHGDVPPTTLSPPPKPDAAAIGALAPEGVLRVGINLSNSLLVVGVGEDGQPNGVSPSIARDLASGLGVPLEMVTYPGPAEVVSAMVSGEVDVGNVGADPGRAEHLVFTGPYSEIEATYLVRADSGIETVDQVDRPEVRIVSRRGAAYTLWLDRSITRAQVIHADTIEESLQRFLAEGLEVLAGLRPRLIEDSERTPAARLLDGRFTSVQQAIGIRRDRDPSGPAYLQRFVDWAIDSGAVETYIRAHGATGLTVPVT